MTAAVIVSMVAGLMTFVTSLLVLSFYLSGRFTKIETAQEGRFSNIESTQEVNREHIAELINNTRDSIMASVRLMMGDERMEIEHRFDEIEKNVERIRNEMKQEIQKERHNINNVGQKIQMHMEQHKREL